VTVGATPIGLMNHITMSTPDVPACKRFWIDFLGGEWYSESFRLIQVLIGGILVDFFPPLDPNDEEAVPAPGSPVQQFRFAISPDQVGPWVARAEEWQVRTDLQVQESLLRLALVFEAPAGYHVALEARYPSVEALRDAAQQHERRVANLSALTGPGLASSPPSAQDHRADPLSAEFDLTHARKDGQAGMSESDIAMIERAVAVADAAIFHLGYAVRVGMTQTEALSILEASILRAGGDPGHQARWECGPAPKGIPGRALHAPLQRFDVIQAELTPSVAGYGARELHPVCVGKPPQRIYEMFELACNVFNVALPLLTPGRSPDACLAAATQAAADSPYEVTLDVAAAGRADHRTASAEGRPGVLQDQQGLTVNALARDADGTSIAFCTTVVVTPEGGRRLSKRPLELMLTSRSFLSAYTAWRPPEPTAPWLSPS
jgi:hypothetical protein